MIRLFLNGKQKNQKWYLFDLCLRILRLPHHDLTPAELAGTEDVIVTDRAGAGSRTIYFPEERILNLLDQITLSAEIDKGLYDRYGRLSRRPDDPDYMPAPINEFTQELKHRLREFGIESEKGKPVVFLSHDVDKISNRELYATAGKIARFLKGIVSFDFQTAWRNLRSLTLAALGKNTYACFERYMELEARFGMRSTFFFMTGRGGLRGAKYDVRKLKPVLQKLQQGGWEIGLHVNYYGCDNAAEIKRQKMRLEEITGTAVEGARIHWLKFSANDTYRVLEQAGFRYDATLGAHDRLGFRAGCAQAFNPYDVTADKPMALYEIPLAIMDVALFEYMKLSPEEAWKRILEIFEEFKDQNAVIAILWHSNVLEDPLFEGWREVYEKILRYLAEQRIDVMTGRDICQNYTLGH